MKSSEDGTYKVTEHFAVWHMLERRESKPDVFRLHPFKACDISWKEMVKVLKEKKRDFDLLVCCIASTSWTVCIVGVTEANKSNMVRSGSICAKSVQRTLKCLCKYSPKSKTTTKITNTFCTCANIHMLKEIVQSSVERLWTNTTVTVVALWLTSRCKNSV